MSSASGPARPAATADARCPPAMPVVCRKRAHVWERHLGPEPDVSLASPARASPHVESKSSTTAYAARRCRAAAQSAAGATRPCRPRSHGTRCRRRLSALSCDRSPSCPRRREHREFLDDGGANGGANGGVGAAGSSGGPPTLLAVNASGDEVALAAAATGRGRRCRRCGAARVVRLMAIDTGPMKRFDDAQHISCIGTLIASSTALAQHAAAARTTLEGEPPPPAAAGTNPATSRRTATKRAARAAASRRA